MLRKKSRKDAGEAFTEAFKSRFFLQLIVRFTTFALFIRLTRFQSTSDFKKYSLTRELTDICIFLL